MLRSPLSAARRQASAPTIDRAGKRCDSGLWVDGRRIGHFVPNLRSRHRRALYKKGSRMRIAKQLLWAAVAALVALAWPGAAAAQEVIKEAMADFPSGTVRLEYSSPAKLRSLPDYATLSQRYVGPRLQQVETSMSQLGVQQSDIDELVLGWQAQGGGLNLIGLAQGHFDSRSAAQHAATQGIAATPVGGTSAYCFGEGAAGNCIVFLAENLGAFGTLESLDALLKARAGEAASAATDSDFARRVDDAKTDAPIWGVAVGPSVVNCFKGWLPSQNNLNLDWTQTFQTVDAVSYTVEPKDQVHLAIKLDCKTSQGAAQLRQVMQGLKIVQQMAWQAQNPNVPNPFQSLQVDVSGRQVQMNLTTAYAQLEAGSLPGKS